MCSPTSTHLYRVCVCFVMSGTVRRFSVWHTNGFTQLPPFPQTALQAAEVLVAAVEELQFSASPAPPDSQAPGHVFITKATHNSVFSNQRCLGESPAHTGREKWAASDQRRLFAEISSALFLEGFTEAQLEALKAPFVWWMHVYVEHRRGFEDVTETSLWHAFPLTRVENVRTNTLEVNWLDE